MSRLHHFSVIFGFFDTIPQSIADLEFDSGSNISLIESHSYAALIFDVARYDIIELYANVVPSQMPDIGMDVDGPFAALHHLRASIVCSAGTRAGYRTLSRQIIRIPFDML